MVSREMRRLLEPPDEIRSLAGRVAPHEIDLCSRAMPMLPGLRRPSQWIICGRYGTPMHEDREMTRRYTVLLPVVADAGWWIVYMVGPYAEIADASAYKPLMLDNNSPHALYYEPGEHADGWIALSWDVAGKVPAERLLERVGWLLEDAR